MTNPTTLISTPFANSGTKNTIPDSGASAPQLATMEAGFPAVTQTPINEGGIPPERADFNGLGNLVTEHLAFLNKGNWYEFDGAFAAKIGGYPLHARLQLDNGDIAQSTIPNNTNNPNTSMTGWLKSGGITSVNSVEDLPTSSRTGDIVFVKSYYSGLNKGSSFRYYDSSRSSENDGFLCINGWVLIDLNNNASADQAGAVGDGVFDDTNGIQRYVDYVRSCNLQGRNWNISSKISIPSGRFLNLSGSNISASNGTDPIFEFENSGDGLYILHGGGVITGTADSFLKCSGSTNSPTSIGEYARQIRLEGIVISSETIDKFLDFQNAVRQVFMNKVHAYTKNGINAIGKCVEVKAQGCIIYGSTGESDTYGIKLRSPAGGAAYNEGFHFTDCTNDNFGITYDVTDIYAMSVTGGHSGCVAGGKVAVFGQPTSTACRDMKFTGVNIAGPVEFTPTSGRDYHAQFTGCVSEMCNGINIHIRNNASSIKVSDHDFHTSTNGVAIVCNAGTNNISINDISCDSTFISGIQMVGSNGENCSIRNLSYSGTGDEIYLERPVLLSGIPSEKSGVLGYFQGFNSNSIQGTIPAGTTISSVSSWFAKGETGNIICEISFSGANVTNQILEIVTPSGMNIAEGSGWSSRFIVPSSVSGRISAVIPYSITSNISSGAISIKNSAGNTLNIEFHSYFGFKRNS